jgi:hypothetical protein
VLVKLIGIEILTVDVVLEYLAPITTDDILSWEVTMDCIEYYPDSKEDILGYLESVAWDPSKVAALKRRISG